MCAEEAGMKSARQLLRVDRPIKEHSLCGASSPVPYRTPVASLSRHNARKRVHKPEGTGVMKRGQSSLSREGSAVNCAPRRVYRPSVGSETKSQRPPKQEITGFTAGPIPALSRASSYRLCRGTHTGHLRQWLGSLRPSYASHLTVT
jgi:hypothetical protein